VIPIIEPKHYPQVSTNNLGRFDKMLLETVDEVLRTALGAKSTLMIYDYLKNRSCSPIEIPTKLEIFSTELRNILFEDKSPPRFLGGITPIGRSAIIERTISRILCRKLGLDFKIAGPVDLPSLIPELRVLYRSKEERSSIPNHSNKEAAIN
jgi:hypothetical protein